MSKDLRVRRGGEYTNSMDEIEETESGRCIAVAWVRRTQLPGLPPRSCFKDDPEFSGFADRMVQCTNACAGLENPDLISDLVAACEHLMSDHNEKLVALGWPSVDAYYEVEKKQEGPYVQLRDVLAKLWGQG